MPLTERRTTITHTRSTGSKPPLTRRTGSGVTEFQCKKHDRWYLAACVTCLFETRRDRKKLDEPKPMTRTTEGGVIQFRCKQHEVWYSLNCLKCMMQTTKKLKASKSLPHPPACICDSCVEPIFRREYQMAPLEDMEKPPLGNCTCSVCNEARRAQKRNRGIPPGAIFGHDVSPPVWSCTCLYCVNRHLRNV